jgi:DNA (cytosine-5)-methyltransferase 1
MSLGVEQAGFEIVAAVEIDPIHCATHKFNFPNCQTICRSVTASDGRQIRQLAGLDRQNIDVVVGGPPCQGFSLMGKRALDDPRNALVYHFVRLVLELNPSYFIFENVAGLTVGQHRRFLEEIIQEFEDGGYRVITDYQVLNAADCGIPQNRRRLFLLGARGGEPLPTYPESQQKPVTDWEAIGDLPEVEDLPELLTRDWVKATFGLPSPYVQRLRAQQAIPGNFGYLRHFEPDVLTASRRTKHSDACRARFASTPKGTTERISKFYKLAPDGVCNTLRAGTASDRGAFTSPRPIHPYTPRCLTVREAARLHSYPDWFRFHVTKWHGFRQIGNSVPPLLAQAVAAQIMAALGKSPQHPTEILELGDESLLSLSKKEAAALFGVKI